MQLDIDHIPKPEYLDKTLGHFRDTKVGWVQAPSVYHNLKHWTARGSAELELGLQGPLQMGFYSNTEAPVIIGSHTTFRMAAIQEIGGFQPTRAEDHLNTLALMDKGWKGVYLPEVIAEGEGPETLNAFITQQYAWAFSMFQILKSYSRPYLTRMTLRKRLQFLFLQTWYPLWSLSYFVMFLVPVVGLLFNTHAVQSHGSDFIQHFLPAFLSTLLSWHIARPLFQPRGLGLSWRGRILHVIRWPIILMAVVSAGLGHTKPYQITPKGKFLKNVPTIKLYRPFLLLSFISAAAMLFHQVYYQNEATSGLLVFAGTNLVVMLSVCLVDLNIRLRQRKIKIHIFRRYWLRPTIAVASVLFFASSVLAISLSSWQQTIYAQIAPSVPNVSRDIAALTPSALSDIELMQEIASKKYVTQSQDLPSVGVYSPVIAPEQSGSYIRHTFVDWREDWRIQQELLVSLRAHNVPLITIEPKGEADGAKLLQDIRDGKHDDIINRFVEIASQTDNDVYIRFAHEMEIADLYPWGGQDPQLFIAAYRHVVETARKKGADNIKWVWSPGGGRGAEVYYPGDDVVDVVGATIIYDQYFQGDTYVPFYDLVYTRLWLGQYKKPVWMAELGIGKANPELQRVMISEAIAHHKEFGFSAVVYLNIPDSNVIGPDYRLDDLTLLGGPFTLPPAKSMPPLGEKNTAKHSDSSEKKPAIMAVPTKDVFKIN